MGVTQTTIQSLSAEGGHHVGGISQKKNASFREGFRLCRMECINGLANNMCMREHISGVVGGKSLAEPPRDSSREEGGRVLLKQRGNSCRFQHFLFCFAGEKHKFPAPAIMRSRDRHCWALWIAENFDDSRCRWI